MNLKNKPTSCDANLSLLPMETEFLALPYSFNRDGVLRARVRYNSGELSHLSSSSQTAQCISSLYLACTIVRCSLFMPHGNTSISYMLISLYTHTPAQEVAPFLCLYHSAYCPQILNLFMRHSIQIHSLCLAV